MIKKDTFMYDEELDRLMIFNNIQEDETIYGSVRILNLVLDITNQNRIANLEIRNISEYLESNDINPQILKNLTNARINVTQIRGGFLINIILTTLDRVEKVSYSIPTEKEIIITA